MVEFGEQLRRAREAKGMTQQSLAEQLYVTRQSVSRWECGDRYPDLLTTTKIAQILEVSLDDLLSGKEMEKVVERNPVVENKVANNIMTALYAVVLLSMIIPILNGLLTRQAFADTNMPGYDSYVIIKASIVILEIFCFTFGLVNAIKGSLSPKRMGAVIGAYFAANCISGAESVIRSFPPQSVVWNLNNGDFLKVSFMITLMMLPGIAGATGTFFYFIRNKNLPVWPVVITLASIIGISLNIFSKMNILTNYSDNFSMNHTLSLVLVTAIYVLIIYQTFTLVFKRKRAKETAGK
ncbi:MAG: helix-turn-helix domain-containing protein [Clostridiales bacterium]|nr:helix-turn-helix domain-containing protein [Clostridiales bacterium]